MKVSVLLPSYNYAGYLARALESVLDQTREAFEIVAVDDGSRDGSREVLAAWAARYPGKVRVFTHPGGAHRGIAATLKLALERSRGDVIAFLDADDFWHPRNLEKKLDAFRKNPQAGVVYSAYRPVGPRRGRFYWRLYALSDAWARRAGRPVDMSACFLARNPVASFSHFAVRRKLLEAVPDPPGWDLNFDWWVLAHLSLGTKFVFLPGKLSAWRIHPQSAWHGELDRRRVKDLMFFKLGLFRSLRAAGASRRMLQRIAAARRRAARARCFFRPGLATRAIFAARYPVFTARFAVHLFLRKKLLTGVPNRHLVHDDRREGLVASVPGGVCDF